MYYIYTHADIHICKPIWINKFAIDISCRCCQYIRIVCGIYKLKLTCIHIYMVPLSTSRSLLTFILKHSKCI